MALPGRIGSGRISVRRLLQSRRLALAACVLATLLLVAQSARALIARTREQEFLARTESEAASRRASEKMVEAGAGASHGPAGAPGTTADGGSAILKLLPREGQPGLLLSDLFEILSAAGIETYRYRLLTGQTTEPGAEVPETRIEDRPIEELLSGDELDQWEGADLVPLGLDGAEIPPPPPGLQKWELALSVHASYVRLIHALRLLEADERIWDVPRLAVHRGRNETEADLRLVTYTRDPQHKGDSPPVEVPAVPGAPFTGRDPFARKIVIEGSETTLVPPRLGAIRLGAGEAAWLDGGPVRRGERAGNWTVLSIQPGEVWVRHDSGEKRCLRLDERARKETSDEQP